MASRGSLGLLVLVLAAAGVHAQPGSGSPAGRGVRAPTPDIVLSEQKGCGPGPYLTPNMQNCVVDDFMGSNGTLSVGFSVSPKAAKKHGLLLTLRSVGGAAVMRVLSSAMGAYNGRVVYFNDAVTESVLRIPASELTGGDYTIVIQGMGGATQKLLLYLRVQTPLSNITLVDEEKEAMLAIWKECCPITKGLEAPDVCAKFLPDALKATKAEDDLCNLGNFVCNEAGQLEKIDFSNAGLKCKKFPEAFGRFPSLETLMLRFNNFNEDSFENVAEVMSTATNLRRLMMGNTNLTGTIPCRLFEEHTLKTLMFSVNKLEGELPDCVLAHKSLEELYMSRLPLTGSLPDSIPEDSSLTVWYAINKDPITGRPAGPGFSGPLPRSLERAGSLAFLEMSGHQLTGGVPTLPAKIRMFEAHNNKLNGGIASPLPESLIYFDVSNNSIIGPLPDVSSSKDLTLLDVSRNQLTGQLPGSFGAAGDKLVYIDLSRNALSGEVSRGTTWERLPALQYLFLQDNNLEGSVPATLAGNKKLVALNMAYNKLTGDLEAFGDAINPPRKESIQVGPESRGRRMLRSLASRHTEAESAELSVAASMALAKKLLGTREDWSISQLGDSAQQSWALDLESIRALATGDISGARRRLMQSVTEKPAAGGATTSTVERPSAAAAAAEPPVEQEPLETPAVTPVSATPVNEPAETLAETPAKQEPAAEAPSSASTPSQEPSTPVEPTPATAPSGPGPRTTAGPNPGMPKSRPDGDVGFIALPSRSGLAGNSFLYLNLSNNELESSIPESFGNMEMFRSPANSSDPFDMFVFSRGGPDRTMDLTYNKLYGEFPRFLVNQGGDLSDACLCTVNFAVSAGNQLYCPTRASLAGFKATPNALDTIKTANYTCLLPNQRAPVSLAEYLADPSGYISAVPSRSELPAPEARPADSPSYAASRRAGSSGGSGGMGPGEIAGVVIGSVAGAGILAALAYFVGYKRLYQVHDATSFKRSDIPEGPAMDGVGAYPAAAYGGSTANVPVSSGPARPI